MTDYEVASPCINVCKIDEQTQLCIGCGRTIEEIMNWTSMDNVAKQAIIDRLTISLQP